jgi:methylmalonyl-CoA mutase
MDRKNGKAMNGKQSLAKKYKSSPKPSYYNPSAPERLPEGNNGLGLQLIGFEW